MFRVPSTPTAFLHCRLSFSLLYTQFAFPPVKFPVNQAIKKLLQGPCPGHCLPILCLQLESTPHLWWHPTASSNLLTDVPVAHVGVLKLVLPLLPSSGVAILVSCARCLSGLQALHTQNDVCGPRFQDLERSHLNGTDWEIQGVQSAIPDRAGLAVPLRPVMGHARGAVQRRVSRSQVWVLGSVTCSCQPQYVGMTSTYSQKVSALPSSNK